jgi:hypothetical protein
MTRPLARFSTVALFALFAAPALADVAISEEARSHFNAGVNFLQDPDGARHEEAYHEFKAAYAASPSWKILGNLGISAMKLERDGEAIEAYSKYLSEGGSEIDAADRAQISKDLDTLRAAVVEVTLTSNPAGATITDERFPTSGNPVRNRYGTLAQATTLGVRPGHHRFTATLSGYQDVVWEVDLEPRQKTPFEFKFAQPAAGGGPEKGGDAGVKLEPTAPSNPLRTVSYVAIGVGAVTAGVGTYFMLQSNSEFDEANGLCPSFPCDLTPTQANHRTQLGEDGDSHALLSKIMIPAGAAILATGVVLFFVSGNKTSTVSEKTASAPSGSVSPWVSVDLDGSRRFGLEGTF